MITTKTAVVLIGLSAATLFSACKKNDYMTPDNSNNATIQSTKDANGNAGLKFNSGSIYTSTLLVRNNGVAMADAGGSKMWNLTSPVMNAGLNLKPGYYNNLVTTVQLTSGSGMAALHLTGTVILRLSDDEFMGRNVDFSINTPLQFQTSSGPITVSEGTTLLTLLNLRLGDLGADIPSDTWKKAMDENQYTIYISGQNNTELYNAIFRNLQAMLQTTGTTTEPAPASAYNSMGSISNR